MKFDMISAVVGLVVGVVGSAAAQKAYASVKAKFIAYVQKEAAKLAADAKKA